MSKYTDELADFNENAEMMADAFTNHVKTVMKEKTKASREALKFEIDKEFDAVIEAAAKDYAVTFRGAYKQIYDQSIVINLKIDGKTLTVKNEDSPYNF